jgi:hypothetical protein
MPAPVDGARVPTAAGTGRRRLTALPAPGAGGYSAWLWPLASVGVNVTVTSFELW